MRGDKVKTARGTVHLSYLEHEKFIRTECGRVIFKTDAYQVFTDDELTCQTCKNVAAMKGKK